MVANRPEAAAYCVKLHTGIIRLLCELTHSWLSGNAKQCEGIGGMLGANVDNNAKVSRGIKPATKFTSNGTLGKLSNSAHRWFIQCHAAHLA